MDESSFSRGKSDSFLSYTSSYELEKKPLNDNAAAAGGGSHIPPAPRQGQSTQVQPKKGRARERLWTTVLFVTIASLPALLVGCTLAFPSIALLDLSELEEREDFKLSTLLSDVFGAMVPVGAIFGGPIAGWIADHFGRKAAIMLVGIPYLSGYLMISYAHMLNSAIVFKVVLLLGRFLTGFGLGWSCVTGPVYAAEVSSSKFRGIFGSFTQLFLSVGLVVVYLLGSFSGFQYFRISLVLIGIIAVFEIGALFICDSPRWLLAHGHRQEAISALKRLRGPYFDIDHELSTMELDLSQSPHLKTSKMLIHFTKRDVVLPLIITLLIMFFRQIGGLNASMAYSGLIFKEAGVENYRATATYAVGGTVVVFTIISLFIVDFFGRKSLLIVSGIGMLLGTALLGTQFFITRPSLCSSNNSTLSEMTLNAASNSDVLCNAQYAPLAIVSLILFIAAFSIGWGPVPWVLLGELIPLRVRGVGSGIATLVNWSTAAIVTGFYLNYVQMVKPWFAWWTFSVLNLLAVLFVVFFVSETKGKSLEEINSRYKKQPAKKHHSHL